MADVPLEQTGLLQNIIGLGLPGFGARRRQRRGQSAEDFRLAQLVEERQRELPGRQQAVAGLIRANPELNAIVAAAGPQGVSQIAEPLASADPTTRAIGTQTLLGLGEQLGAPGLLEAQEQAEKAARITSQREALKFQQETQKRDIDFRTAQQNFIQQRRAFVSEVQTGFKTPEAAIEFASQANVLKSNVDSIDTMILVRESLGNLSLIEAFSNPAAAAAIRNFEEFDSVAIFKKLIEDPRTSDQDREWYRNVIQHGFIDTLTRGTDSIELNQLRGLQERMLRAQRNLAIANPRGALQFPELFLRKNFDDIGTPFQRPRSRNPDTGAPSRPKQLSPTEQALIFAR